MDEQRKKDLNTAYHTLCEYMLWRKGYTNAVSFTSTGIGDAIAVAAGGILDYIKCDTELSITDSSLKMAECELERSHKELRRLRAILAGHGIKYGKEGGK